MYLVLLEGGGGVFALGFFGLMCRKAIDPPHPSTSLCLSETLPSFLQSCRRKPFVEIQVRPELDWIYGTIRAACSVLFTATPTDT